jgi:aspartyl-tRNA(Asn)/glutamyl-tRNA(Gln) amidotransferase subunit B
VKKLRNILRYLGACDGDMEKGNLRADVNVSVRKVGGELGTRCEIKNVNSYRYIQQAIEHEARRQIEIIEDGGKIDQETRLFDPHKGETRSMRSKEEAHDYRYFPDPDLLPLELDPAWIKEIEASLPELPDAKRARLQSQYGLSAYDARVLAADQEAAAFFEEAARERDAKLIANTVTQAVATRINAEALDWRREGILHVGADGAALELLPADVGELVRLQQDGTISTKIAMEVFERMWAGEGSPAVIVETHGLVQVTDTSAIEAVADKIIAANPDKAAQVKERPQAIGWFVGQVMRETGGKANPAAVNEILQRKLGI